ncbi:HEPN domain-containing protein [Amycolatopsis sp. NPDC021455]|uniref:HEPN domain-containing protein n=1 Tax=Amycolatopsis sp. NPDC021455 TaxID=3154901 RepID=UPI0033F6C2EE
MQEAGGVTGTGRAYSSFLFEAVPDVVNLIKFHVQETGTKRGRRRPEIQVVTRSAIVLVCAYWEAFCEDLAAEALLHLADYAPDAKGVPHAVQRTLIRNLNDSKNDLTTWALAGDGWRTALRDRAKLISGDMDRSLNTPKSYQVREFFKINVGIGDITQSWSWHKNPPARTTDLLDEFVTLRGRIAHRGSTGSPVYKQRALRSLNFVMRLAERSAVCTSLHLEAHTGKQLE